METIQKVQFLKFFFFKHFIIFREWGGERGKEKSVWLPLVHPQPGTQPATQACALGISWQPFCLQAGAQSTEPHQPGQNLFF